MSNLVLSCLTPAPPPPNFAKLNNSCEEEPDEPNDVVGFSVLFPCPLFILQSQERTPTTTPWTLPTEIKGREEQRWMPGIRDAHHHQNTPETRASPQHWIQTLTLYLTLRCTSAAEEEREEILLKAELQAALG